MCRLTSNHVRIPSHTQLSGSYPLPGRQKTLYNPLLNSDVVLAAVLRYGTVNTARYRNAHCTPLHMTVAHCTHESAAFHFLKLKFRVMIVDASVSR